MEGDKQTQRGGGRLSCNNLAVPGTGGALGELQKS